MALVTFQVLEGLERGKTFADLPTPLTIGREDDNAIQLNDERVSRFHTKIQDDGDRIILTDLESTNGTRINGHPVQMRVLQPGDQLSIGRCLLVFGSRSEIAERTSQIEAECTLPSPGSRTMSDVDENLESCDASVADMNHTTPIPADIENQISELFPIGRPELPKNLQPLQLAQTSDVLAFIHDRVRTVLQSGLEPNEGDPDQPREMCIDWGTWQRLVQLEMDLAVYLRKVADPDS